MIMSEEESDLVYKFIYLPLVRKVLERDLTKIKQAGLKFNDPYITFIEKRIIQTGKEIGDIKWKMNARNIKVYEDGLEKKESMTVSNYLVVYRGYREVVRLPDYVIRNNVMEYMRDYIK